MGFRRVRQVQALVTGDQDPAEVALFWLERRSGRLPPEKRMMYAIIEHAVHDIRHMRTAGQLSSALKMAQIRQRTTAIAWVYSDDTTWSHSFLNCCEALGWLPAMVREQIRQDIESTEPLTCGAPDAPRLRLNIRQTPLPRLEGGAA